MRKFDPSPEQQLAIDAIDKNYLISAGAGSGKTAVLTERIFKLVKENQRLDNFLILTFTNLAAGEMKERVRQKLASDETTSRFAVEVDNTHIETFDSFYLFLAKKYFYKLGIDKSVSVISGPIIEIKERELLDALFRDYIVNEDSRMLALIKEFSLKDNEALKKFILQILKVADSKTDKEAYYDLLENGYGSDEFIASIIKEKYELLIKSIRFMISKVKSANLENLEDEGNILDHLHELLNQSDYTSLTTYINEHPFPRKLKYEDSRMRDALAIFYKNNIAQDYLSEAEIKDVIIKNQEYISFVLEIVKKIDASIDEFKKKHNAYSFPDISRMVLTLLKDPEIVKEVSEQFDYIMVDEYQDTNDIQETVLNIIGRNNIYMVGDIKQSIYRFRNADCQIFNEKFNEYKAHKGGEEIDLNQSFRSRMEIVDFINDIFSKIMTKENNKIDYSNGHNFRFGQKDYGGKNKKYQTVEYRYLYEKTDECANKEAVMMAKDIIDKMNNNFEVYDFKEKTVRPVKFSDFAIIIDRESDFEEIRKVFSSYAIPLRSCGKEKLMTSDITVALRSLLKLLYLALNSDYGEDYKHAFMSVARSFLIEMKDQEIYDLFKDKEQNKVLLSPLAQKIELIKEKLRFASLYEILKTLYEEFHIYDHICKITNYYANAHKAEILLDFARQMDALGLSIKDLVEYFDNLSAFDLDIDYRDNDSQENSVTLINIHQSKGLEYNIVYYPLLYKEFMKRQYYENFFVSKKYGLIFPDDHNLLKSLHVYQEKQEETEEKIRLLYVALTRAKQKIILIIGKKDRKNPLIQLPHNSSSLAEIYDLSDIGNKYVKEFPFDEIELSLNKAEEKEEKKIVPISLKSISISSNLIKKEKASKESAKADEDLLNFGTEVHAILEGLDFTSKDTSKIANPRFKKIADNVLKSPVFKDVTREMVKPEFRYYDEVNNVTGVIDCLVDKPSEILIVDYKLKNIADEEYEKQLRTYYKYIASISDKPIKMYLLAALTGELKEVKNV